MAATEARMPVATAKTSVPILVHPVQPQSIFRREAMTQGARPINDPNE